MKNIKNLLLEKVQSNQTAILTHVNPDGDGLAAALALKEIFSTMNILTDIILEEEPPSRYAYLHARKNCQTFSPEMSYNVIIILDCHEEERLGKCANLLPNSKTTIAIDHHPEGKTIPEAENYINPRYVSVGAILFEMFSDEIEEMDYESRELIINAFYTTILNDSSNFTNANTDEKTFIIAAKLRKLGVVPGDIHQKFFQNKPIEYLQFISDVLSTISTFDNKQIVMIHSTNEMLKKHSLDKHATDQMTSWIKGTAITKVIIYFREISQDIYKLSLRSNFINVKKIANKFGGGGHIKAAGCTLEGNLEDLKEIVLAQIREQLK